jgi:hypothetical protein
MHAWSYLAHVLGDATPAACAHTIIITRYTKCAMQPWVGIRDERVMSLIAPQHSSYGAERTGIQGWSINSRRIALRNAC